jgi:hypothetical protein
LSFTSWQPVLFVAGKVFALEGLPNELTTGFGL